MIMSLFTVMLSVAMEIVDKFINLVFWKIIRIESKVFVLKHGSMKIWQYGSMGMRHVLDPCSLYLSTLSLMESKECTNY